jgi:AsmA protein
VQLSNAPGFGNTPFAKVKHVDVSVALLPILTGNIQIKNIGIDGLSLNLARNKTGGTNWDDLTQKAAEKNTTAPVAAPATTTNHSANTANTENKDTKPQSLNFTIANLTIVNSELTWTDQQSNQSYKLGNFYINGSDVGTEQLFPLTISFDINGQNFATPIKFSFNGNFNINNELTSVAVNSADLSVNNIELQGDLSFERKNEKLTYQGDLQLAPFNINKVAAQFKIDLPKFANKNAFHKIGADLAFNGTENSLVISPFNITVDSTNLNGNLSIKNFAKPKINFKLTGNQFNLDNYVPVSTTSTSSANNSPVSSTDLVKSSGAEHTTYSTEKINLPVELLRNLELNGNITLAEFIAKNVHMNNINAAFLANGGILKIAPFKMNLYEGTALVNTTIDVTGAIPRYQFSADLNKVQGGALLADMLGKDFVSGTANFSQTITTQGDNVKTLVNNLNGNLSFAFTQGVLKGININYEIARAKALLDKKSAPRAPSDNNTSFGKITGTVKVINGMATNDDLFIDNESFKGHGKGTANLNSQQLDYQIKFNAEQIAELKGYQIPLMIHGPFDHISVKANISSIVQQVLREQAKKAINDALKIQASKSPQGGSDLQKALGSLLGQ